MRVMTTVAMFGAILAACGLAGGAAPAEKRELLSDHVTVARLAKLENRKCMGRTARCPDQCGDSGLFASFEIVSYLDYSKKGQYGDPKSKSFMFQIEDNHGKPKTPAALADKLKGIEAGDLVRLHWHHDYVTRTEGGGSSSFPERPVVALEKLTKEEADKLTKAAAEMK